jgi:hypothetical protein
MSQKRKHFKLSAKYFQDSKYSNVKINSTQDPNKFLLRKRVTESYLNPELLLKNQRLQTLI